MSTVYLTPREMAARLGIDVRTLANKRGLGRGPTWIKHGPRVFYPVPDLSNFDTAVSGANGLGLGLRTTRQSASCRLRSAARPRRKPRWIEQGANTWTLR